MIVLFSFFAAAAAKERYIEAHGSPPTKRIRTIGNDKYVIVPANISENVPFHGSKSLWRKENCWGSKDHGINPTLQQLYLHCILLLLLTDVTICRARQPNLSWQQLREGVLRVGGSQIGELSRDTSISGAAAAGPIFETLMEGGLRNVKMIG